MENNFKFYNTLTKKIETVIPHEDGKIAMYTCGPTVYHFAHIGNLRSYIMEDVQEKSLRYVGYDVKRVMNITDVGHLASDAGALNMPSRITDAPWAIPFQCLVFKFGFGEPEHEVCLVFLIGILIDIIPYTDQRLEFCLCGENIVIIQFGRVKVNVSACLISVTLF